MASTARAMPSVKEVEPRKEKEVKLKVVEPVEEEAKTRLRVLKLLRQGKNVSDVARITGMNKFGVHVLSNGTHGFENTYELANYQAKMRGFADSKEYVKFREKIMVPEVVMPVLLRDGTTTTQQICDEVKSRFGYDFKPSFVGKILKRQEPVFGEEKIGVIVVEDSGKVTYKPMNRIF